MRITYSRSWIFCVVINSIEYPNNQIITQTNNTSKPANNRQTSKQTNIHTNRFRRLFLPFGLAGVFVNHDSYSIHCSARRKVRPQFLLIRFIVDLANITDDACTHCTCYNGIIRINKRYNTSVEFNTE